MKVLVVDIGGSHVKILLSGQTEPRRAPSGPRMSPASMVQKVRALAKGWDFDVISIGYPGPVRDGAPVGEPPNLGKGWVGFDYAGAFGKPVKLIDALGDWRAEVVSRLQQSGVQGEWSAPSDDEVPQTLSSRAYVQTTRILREAVSNIIKHSGASHVKVRCAIHHGNFGINIQDNGKGIPMELDGKLDRGHGMTTMKQRAKQMQGQCLVESGPGYGTVIRLTLPLGPEAPAAASR